MSSRDSFFLGALFLFLEIVLGTSIVAIIKYFSSDVSLGIVLMFRYIYPLSKKAKRIMFKESTLNWSKSYPKDNDLKWFDKTENPKVEISKPSFTYKDMKYNPQSKKKVKPSIDLMSLFS